MPTLALTPRLIGMKAPSRSLAASSPCERYQLPLSIKNHPLRFTLLLAVLVGEISRLPAITFEEWRSSRFTSAELADVKISGYTADPDGDGRSNWMEFGLNTVPTEPDIATGPDLRLGEDGRLELSFFRWADHPGMVYILQVTSDLTQRWKSGATHLPEIGISALNADSDMVTVQDVATVSTSLTRYVRLVISTDSDGDGLPDDWEMHNGLSPFDPTDGNDDIDRDGISNAAEFAAGTDPLLPPAPAVPQTVPEAPSDVRVTTMENGDRLFTWVSNSTNEDYFVIRETNPDGTVVELGRVGPGVTWFFLPASRP